MHANRTHLIPTLMLGLLFPPTVAQAAPDQVIVYTTSDIHLSGVPADAKIISLDRVQVLEEQISHGLSANPQQAQAQINQLMGSSRWLKFKDEIKEANRGLQQAWAVKIDKLPAVTVNDSHVVYGQPNVAVALEMIRKARGL
ncbi:TIGR03757 family integrating conjugative element protein [Pseudomonas sp. GOM7]|uniref:TIGR03757 family integrating conjugative element protein n=1 Tax=Pseudomonas sp. GOM7 TaxID=2998079 RepID=UPI00227C0E97|nr:TIGR03757 family integrating conjugative element protein [Pseudomonas sp. GOM7]WAJ37274.1 TIGR03757 family integrating conjugative element protein [Pseudomonas sp. GOM7]